MQDQLTIPQLKKLLATPKTCSIVIHRNPDGDALGSALSLAYYLRRSNHQVSVISPSDYPEYLSWMPDIDKVIIADNELKDSKFKLFQSELIFCLDFNNLDRVDVVALQIAEAKCPVILLDHHEDPVFFADLMYTDIKVSSTSELLFKFFRELDPHFKPDVQLASHMLTGIITDTGSFRYNINAGLFPIVGELVSTGVDYPAIQQLINNNFSTKQIQLLGYCLDKRMEIIPEFQTAIIYLDKQDFKDFRIARGDTEGIVNYPLMIKNIAVSIFITEQLNQIKFSFRSKGDIAVNKFATLHFQGGGHKNAAGGQLTIPLPEAVDRVKTLLPNLLNL